MTTPTLLDLAKISLVTDAYRIYNNQEKVSKHIGISRRTLRNWIWKYDELKRYRGEISKPRREEILNDHRYD